MKQTAPINKPEGDAELPDEGLPDEFDQEDDDDQEEPEEEDVTTCAPAADLLRMKVEELE